MFRQFQPTKQQRCFIGWGVVRYKERFVMLVRKFLLYVVRLFLACMSLYVGSVFANWVFRLQPVAPKPTAGIALGLVFVGHGILLGGYLRRRGKQQLFGGESERDRCFNCRYALTGLIGLEANDNFVRCPECGEYNLRKPRTAESPQLTAFGQEIYVRFKRREKHLRWCCQLAEIPLVMTLIVIFWLFETLGRSFGFYLFYALLNQRVQFPITIAVIVFLLVGTLYVKLISSHNRVWRELRRFEVQESLSRSLL